MLSIVRGKSASEGDIVVAHLPFEGEDVILLRIDSSRFRLLDLLAFGKSFSFLGIRVVDPNDR